MKFRVVTYNIHRAIGVDRRFRLERVARALAYYDADVVLLQEVDAGAPRSRELDLGRELAQMLDYPYCAIGHNVSLRKGRYGNATLARFPILRERNLDLTISWRKRRGCQHTTLELGKGEHARTLEVFNLHLGLSAMERNQQIQILGGSRELEQLDLSVPCMVGGDFNDWRTLLHPAMTRVLGFRCATELDHGRLLRTYPAFGPTGALDRIYYRGGLRLIEAWISRLAVVRVASDHLPVVADFELR